MTIETCREIAARIWCDPAYSHVAMNAKLAEDIAWLLFREAAARRNWHGGRTDRSTVEIVYHDGKGGTHDPNLFAYSQRVNRDQSFVERHAVDAAAQSRNDVRTPNRIKYLRIPAHTILDVFRHMIEGYPNHIQLPVGLGLPPGTRVLSCRENPDYRTIDFLLEHESFPEHQDGCVVEQLRGNLAMQYVAVDVPAAVHAQFPAREQIYASAREQILENFRKVAGDAPPPRYVGVDPAQDKAGATDKRIPLIDKTGDTPRDIRLGGERLATEQVGRQFIRDETVTCPKCGKALKRSWDFDGQGKQAAAWLCVDFGGSCDYKEMIPPGKPPAWVYDENGAKRTLNDSGR